MRSGIESLAAAGRVVGHAVPDDLVDAVGQQPVGDELEIGQPLLALVGAGTGTRLPAIDAGEGLGGDDGFARQRGGGRGKGGEVGVEEDSLALGDVGQGVGGDDVGGRAVALHAGIAAQLVAECGVGRVELGQRGGGDEGAIVVAHMGMGVELGEEGAQVVAIAAHEGGIEIGRPQRAGQHLP